MPTLAIPKSGWTKTWRKTALRESVPDLYVVPADEAEGKSPVAKFSCSIGRIESGEAEWLASLFVESPAMLDIVKQVASSGAIGKPATTEAQGILRRLDLLPT